MEKFDEDELVADNDKQRYRLYGVLPPFPRESPNSFLQRLSQRYALSFGSLQQAVGFAWNNDADLDLGAEEYASLARTCGLGVNEFSLMFTMFRSIRGRRRLHNMLMFDGPRARYRFCDGCWRQDAVPYLRNEWRFVDWEVCPVHRVSLREACGRCTMPWPLHFAQLAGGNWSRATHLAQCAHCGFDQRRDKPQPIERNCEPLIARGRAIVSAAGHGHFEVSDGVNRLRVDLAYLPAVLVDGWVAQRDHIDIVRDRTQTIGRERRLILERAGRWPAGWRPSVRAEFIRIPYAEVANASSSGEAHLRQVLDESIAATMGIDTTRATADAMAP